MKLAVQLFIAISIAAATSTYGADGWLWSVGIWSAITVFMVYTDGLLILQGVNIWFWASRAWPQVADNVSARIDLWLGIAGTFAYWTVMALVGTGVFLGVYAFLSPGSWAAKLLKVTNDDPRDKGIRKTNDGYEFRMALHAQGERIYLDVPREERQEAQALGLYWDGVKRAFYAMPGIPVSAYYKWIKTVEGTSTPFTATRQLKGPAQ